MLDSPLLTRYDAAHRSLMADLLSLFTPRDHKVTLANFQLDEAAFRDRLQAFLRSSYSEEVWSTLTLDATSRAIANGLMLLVAFLQLFTIFRTWQAMQTIWFILTGKMSAEMSDKSVTRATPEKIHPLLAACILIGPDRKHALALGTFQPVGTYSFDWLAARAHYFAGLYADGPTSSSEESLVRILRNDMYEPFRRQRVPEPFAEGVELYLLDVEVDPNQVLMTPFPFFAFAITDPGPSGLIAALPKAVVEPAIRTIGQSQPMYTSE